MKSRMTALGKRMLAAYSEVRRLVECMGVRKGLLAKGKSALVERFSPAGTEYMVPWPNHGDGVVLRTGTSDIHVYKQILLRRELNFSLNYQPKFVLDGGANIGLAAVSFALDYPRAVIVCVEPDENNLRILRRNVFPFGDRVLVFSGALWNRSCNLRIDNPDSDSWAFQVVEDPNGPIRAYSVMELAVAAGISDGFDLVKLDIEGAERDVFSGDISWTNFARTIAVELHDWLIPGSGQPVRAALKQSDWILEEVGEYSIFSRSNKDA